MVNNLGTQDYLAGIVTGLHAAQFGFDSQNCKMFLSPTVSRLALGPSQSPLQWILGVISLRVKSGWGHEADRSLPSSTEVKNGVAVPPSPYVFMA